MIKFVPLYHFLIVIVIIFILSNLFVYLSDYMFHGVKTFKDKQSELELFIKESRANDSKRCKISYEMLEELKEYVYNDETRKDVEKMEYYLKGKFENINI